MQYQTKWVRNMSKLFSFRSSPLMRTFVLAGLVLGSLVVAITSLQLSQMDAKAALATSKYVGYAPAVSINVTSNVDQQTVSYTLTVRNATHAGIIDRSIPVTFTDTIPQGLQNIVARGRHWYTKVHAKATPSVVTGTYLGGYPIAPGAVLPPVIITATITGGANTVLTNSALVYVPGNTDRLHNRAIVHNHLRSARSFESDSDCDINCNDQTSDPCSSSNSNACDSQSIDISVQRTIAISAQESVSSSNLASQSVSNGNASQGNVSSNSTSCGCDPQSTPTPTTNSNNNGVGRGGVDNTTPSIAAGPSGQGSLVPPPAMPNTGSDPYLQG
jgi:uncharacterized repeat protein (TIGR01451 family)